MKQTRLHRYTVVQCKVIARNSELIHSFDVFCTICITAEIHRVGYRTHIVRPDSVGHMKGARQNHERLQGLFMRTSRERLD